MDNTIIIKSPVNLDIDVFKPQQIVSIAISSDSNIYTDKSNSSSTAFPIASYNRFGAVKILENSGLIIQNGVLSSSDDYFVTTHQGLANANKFLFVNSKGDVGLTQFSGMPTKTSDLINDGDGTSEFVTKAYLDSPLFYIPKAYILNLFEEEYYG